MDKEQKAKVISELHDKFARAKGIIFTDYKGLTVEEISELRKQLRNAYVEYRVVKNTLAKKASDGTPVETAKDSITGPVGIALSYEEPVSLAKRVLAFAKTNEKLKIKGAVIEGKTCELADIKALSDLPSRETLLSVLIGTVQSPMSTLAAALHATVVQIVYAMEALKRKHEIKSS